MADEEATVLTHDKNMEGDNLSAADRAILDTAQTGKGAIALTPELLAGMMASLQERTNAIKENYPKLVAAVPYEMKLAVTAWVFEQIVAHAKEGGSFRYLIYDRLGFNNDAYVPLYSAGGMEISNHFSLEEPK